MNDKLLQCIDLCKTYQEDQLKTEVLNNISFSLERGELTAIVGSSGSGKSTLLHLLGGLDDPTSGQVIFNGISLATLSANKKALLRNEEIGFIYQFHHLLPDFTALENIAMPLLISGLGRKAATLRAQEMLVAVGLTNREHHRPSALSGGERQRVAIGRALINNPSLVMADEPTGNLDHKTAETVFELLIKLNQVHNTTFLVVTHDLELASRFSRILEMKDGHLAPKGK